MAISTSIPKDPIQRCEYTVIWRQRMALVWQWLDMTVKQEHLWMDMNLQVLTSEIYIMICPQNRLLPSWSIPRIVNSIYDTIVIVAGCWRKVLVGGYQVKAGGWITKEERQSTVENVHVEWPTAVQVEENVIVTKMITHGDQTVAY